MAEASLHGCIYGVSRQALLGLTPVQEFNALPSPLTLNSASATFFIDGDKHKLTLGDLDRFAILL